MHPCNLCLPASKKDKMQTSLQLLLITDQPKQLGLQDLKHMASKPQGQMSSKDESSNNLHCVPRALLPYHVRREGQRREDPGGEFNLLKVVPSYAADDQKAQRMSPEKSRKVTLPLHL